MDEAPASPEDAPEAPEERHPGPVSLQLRELLDELAGAPERDLREAWLKGLREGALVGRFELLRELGRGGFGVVYEARDRDLGRLVAFKAVRPGNRSVSEMREQWLLREAEAAAQLNHPNIVTLHDAGKSEHGPYLIFELLHGETLAERLARGPMPVREALAVAVEVARGLAHAHASGVVHRDLKPSNVFLMGDGGVKVLDFGLAHVFGAAGIRGGGTPVYMAPEQWRQEADDARVDVFALGTILFQAIAGEAPFRLVNDRSTCLEPGPAPRLDRPGVPPGLADLLAAMLSKDQAGRPPSGQAVLARLVEAEASLAAESRPALPAPEPVRWWRRRWARWAAIAVVVALVAAVAWQRIFPPEPPERPVVVVTDFANETGEPELERLSGMLITSLEQSRRLTVPTRERMLDVARQVTGSRPEIIDETLGREVARRLRAAAVSLASVRRFGSVYAIDVQVLDPRANEYLFAGREQGGKEEVPALLDRLSERMRAGLRERASEIRAARVNLARAATSSLEAWQHFVRGEELFELQQASETPAWSAAREEYRRAVALAPNFVMAHYRIAYTLRHEWLTERAREALAPALAQIDRAAPKEKAYILALAARLEGQTKEAMRQYRAIVQTYPEEKDAWFAMAQLALTRESGFDHARSIEYAREVLGLAPDYAPAWEQVLISLYARGEDARLLEEAQRYAQAVTSVSSLESLGHAQLVAGRDADAEKTFKHMAQIMPGSPAGLLGLGMLRLQRLDIPEAEEAYRRLATSSDPRLGREGRYGLSWVSGVRGRYREASARLDDVARIDEQLRDVADLSRALGQKVLWTTLGRGVLAEDLVKRGLALVDPAKEPYVDHRHFFWLAVYAAIASGRLDRAEQLREAGRRFGWTHSQRLLDVTVARAQGRAEDARRELGTRYSPRDITEALPLAAAEWALAEGRLDEAIALASESLSMPIFPPHQDAAGIRAVLWPRALLVRARALEARGDPEAARSDLSRLLDLWRAADPGAPDVVRAKAMAARLGIRGR
ncbi:MAG TPA: serine/threonine-protein kinase [Anaeromyxobacteraceae bacterium]|nr:serine/threonine-protein kinase [Anaeromyxobacteraceae bacterium]